MGEEGAGVTLRTGDLVGQNEQLQIMVASATPPELRSALVRLLCQCSREDRSGIGKPSATLYTIEIYNLLRRGLTPTYSPPGGDHA